jgi:hypothetical protein
MSPPLILLVATVIAGTTHIPEPGEEVWQGAAAEFEPPQACAHCVGPRAFAVQDGEPWFLLSDKLVNGSGTSLRLPSTGVDLAAGPSGLWALCSEHLVQVRGEELMLREVRWRGTPLEVSGDGAVMSVQGVDGQPLREGQQSPWGGELGLEEREGRWLATWPGRDPTALPGAHIVDARPVGLLGSGEWVLALTDSSDGSAPEAVRFLAVAPGSMRSLGRGEPNGGLDLQPRRHYAVDPSDGGIYTLIVTRGERLSLRRY